MLTREACMATCSPKSHQELIIGIVAGVVVAVVIVVVIVLVIKGKSKHAKTQAPMKS
jgi:capsular polysaccharide biosynthesis protein